MRQKSYPICAVRRSNQAKEKDGVPQRAAEVEDPYRRGMLTIARASNRAEIAWLREQLTSEEAP